MFNIIYKYYVETYKFQIFTKIFPKKNFIKGSILLYKQIFFRDKKNILLIKIKQVINVNYSNLLNNFFENARIIIKKTDN